jgi:hypothetical protein
MPTRKRVDELHHAQRFYIVSPDRTWVRATESDNELGCAIAWEVRPGTPGSQPYYGLFIGRTHFVKPETMIVPL